MEFFAPLIGLAKRFRGFLFLIAFLVLVCVALFQYAFSQGAFDQLITGILNLEKDQFYSITYTFLWMAFIFIVLGLFLSFVRTRPPLSTALGTIHVFVHEANNRAWGIPGAEVTLVLPGSPNLGTTVQGAVSLSFPSAFAGRPCSIGARKSGYRSPPAVEIVLKHDDQFFIPLEREGDRVIHNSDFTGADPFVVGPPVQPGKFVDRGSELRSILGRLLNQGQSTAIVGQPRIGKTSLLLKLEDELKRMDHFGDGLRWLIVSRLDLQYFDDSETPSSFWDKVLRPLRERLGKDATARRLLKVLALEGYSRDSLKSLFDYLKEQGRLVLLLDEFDSLLSKRHFQDFSFFAKFHVLDAYPSFAYVTASRLSLEELTRRCKELRGAGGSEPFNTLIQIQLGGFSLEAANTLLDWADKALSIDDRHFIHRAAGSSPYLLQAMASALFNIKGEDRHARAADLFFGMIPTHFSDVWDRLDDRTRAMAMILCAVEFGGQDVWEALNTDGIDRTTAMDEELQRLATSCLAARISDGRKNAFTWQGERWASESSAFAWWIRDKKIGFSFSEWLANSPHRLLLTVLQSERFEDAMRHRFDWAWEGIGASARALYDELRK